MSKKQSLHLEVSPTGQAAYLKFPLQNGSERKVAENIRIHDLIEGYSGPDVILDFDRAGQLLGIEVLLE